MIADRLRGTSRLVRLALRRDRVQIPVWVLSLAAIQAVSLVSLEELYPDPEDLHGLAVSAGQSPVQLATAGIVSGDSLGALLASQTVMLFAVAAALMSTLLVVRHTRQNEETGRAELVEAAVVGRQALLTAALIVAVGANIALGGANAILLVALGLPMSGSLVTGASMAAAGIAFAAVAAVAAQVTGSARTANGLAGAVLGAAFLLRALGDMSGEVVDGGIRVVSGWMSWLSPIGWAQQMRPFDDDQWWILALFAVFVAVTSVIAYTLTERRDLGAGLMQPRPGPARAARLLPTAFGSAWRIQRSVLMWWLLALAVAGVAYGTVGNEIEGFLGEGEQAAEMIEQWGGGADSLTDAYFATILVFTAIAASAYAVQALLRMRGEEVAGRLESVLATALSRPRWMGAHVGIVAVGVVLVQLVCGAAMGLAYGMTIGDVAGQLPALVGAALAYVPAILAVAGFAVLVIGGLPRWASALSWGALAACLVIGMLGPILQLPEAVMDISPLRHVPAVPAESVTFGSLVVLGVVAAALAVAGVVLFRRRDLEL
ncbi:anibiotic ABC transporter [Rhodococcus triatomae]|uniref:ABC-2 type transport system permease protein n=1 Tax=Rhodococcus triatomae TaxID=300028 RepID=A0A1G8JKM4_9NOCA|nr:anibiotic ABC transporter [Rhodococcus triatomae]QNG19705.1 anibiotic ABC transporter [Rhodococcus triatomae]QNG24380.1 anibiotic ABC transporter [Rhodococcus triatomae]SDI31190.1 ABC-2 type transport system permease protein [Rhodococcus triatomae]